MGSDELLPEMLQAVVASFERSRQDGRLVDRFYELFLAASPEVKMKFAGTDFPRQKQMLEESLFTLLAGAGSPPTGLLGARLEQIARRHSRAERDIPPALYDLWLECLVQAVRERDPQYSDAIAVAWRRALGPGIEFMKARY